MSEPPTDKASPGQVPASEVRASKPPASHLPPSKPPAGVPRDPDLVRTEAASVGAVGACLAYVGSRLVELRFPAYAKLLELDLGDAHPRYYLRVLLALVAGVVAGGLASRVSRRRALAGPEALAWATGLLVGLAALLVCLFP